MGCIFWRIFFFASLSKSVIIKDRKCCNTNKFRANNPTWLEWQRANEYLNAERAIPHLQIREALSEGWGMLVSDLDEKPHLINCEAICVHEEEAKRDRNACFTSVKIKSEKNVIET